jgi:benzoyl-CoA reductase subunit B
MEGNMSKGQMWETRPLEFWAKAKELRAKWQASASDDAKVLGQGSTYDVDWAECFPAMRIMEDNPAGSIIQAKDSPFARKCRLAAEIRGWGREICGYTNNLWGSLFLGYEADGNPFPLRNFVVAMPAECDQHTKRGQQCRDFSPVPGWNRDHGIYFGPDNEERDKPIVEHLCWCQLREINDLERIFGQRFDNEKMREMIEASDQVMSFARDIHKLIGRTVPSPLSVKDLYSVYTIGFLTKVEPQETVNFWKAVRDEIQWRADNHIAAVGNERFRWIEAHPPSWHFLKYYRYMEQYGAVCVGSQYVQQSCNLLEYKPDGSIDARVSKRYPADTPIETREDAIRILMGPDARAPRAWKSDEYIRRDSIVEFAKIMQADGALLPIWRSGVGCTLTRKEQGMRLRNDAGLSVVYYEGSQPGDRTDLDEKRLLDHLDTWMESFGFEKSAPL